MPERRRRPARHIVRKTEAASPGWRGLPIMGFVLLTLLMFGAVLFRGDTRVLGHQATDLYAQFIAWREFGFRELRAGNLALWNPHIYAGAPYFGGSQGALLYPLNVLFFILPVAQAVNWTMALHICLLGVLTYWWLGFRRLHPGACFVGGVMAMLCGAHFLHIYAGHLPNLCTMVWTPLIFLVIDGVLAEASRVDGSMSVPVWRGPRVWLWSLVGAGAVAMQIFAGHPQYVFFTAVAAGMYALLQLLRLAGSQIVVVGALLGGVYAGGALLAAVQLLASAEAVAETTRSLPLPYEFAAMLGFPPENVLTLIVPGFFGDMTHQPYWGRCYLWEMSIFIGVTGTAMVVYGLLAGGLRRQ